MNWGDARLPERFWQKVSPEPNSGCWLWTATLNQDGYGRYSHKGRLESAHRVAFFMLVGLVGAGLELDHKCRVRCCCNPRHLEPVTHQQNASRGLGGKHHLKKTHCPSGHPYAGSNLIIRDGYRACRTCERAKTQRFRLRRLSCDENTTQERDGGSGYGPTSTPNT